MYMSHRWDYLRSGYLHHRLSVAGCYAIITVTTPLPTKPSATKCQRTEAGERGNYWHADASADVAALDAKYTKELADAKAENDALRDDVAAGRRRLHIKAVRQSVREATTASGVDNAASPWLADTAERDYFTLRRGSISLSKTTGRNPVILMSSR